jgi:hypothetical protein
MLEVGHLSPLQPAKGLPHFITFGEEREVVRRKIAWPLCGGQAIHGNPIRKAALMTSRARAADKPRRSYPNNLPKT